MVENIVRKGEIACYKQFLLFLQCFPQLCIFNVSKCGIVWKWVNTQFQALLTLKETAYENIVEKEIVVTIIFSFSHIFYFQKDRSPQFSNILFVVCKCFQFGPVQNFVI